MVPQFVMLYDIQNGIWMLGLFGLVCVLLIVGVLAMVFSDGGEKNK